ncbi:MAG: WecB/TagA/CpsF family glycosyltransferase [Muribaculaceae bacterium]|nr:WecB/TagA/CpsF family glycosyltransferase [Muribaculaceae bacterium]
MQTFSIKNIKVHSFASSSQLIEYADSVKGILVAVNAEKVINANQKLIDIINSNIGYCDGAGAVKAAHRKGEASAVRIPGCELWLEIVSKFYKSKSFYLVGATQQVVKQTVEKLKSEYPGINIVGWRDGYINSVSEENKLIEDIVSRKPDVVFVAMGSPKQELLMSMMQEVHKAIYQGLGGSFDLYIGNFKRAPRLLQLYGCEWIWRFMVQPTRLKRLYPYLKYAFLLYTGRL